MPVTHHMAQIAEKPHFLQNRLITLVLLAIFLTCQGMRAGSISGTIRYEGKQEGSIYLKATRALSGNRSLLLDGNGDSVAIESLSDLSGPELTIQYWFKGSSIQSAVRQQSGGWIVAGWNNMHILSHDGGTGGIDAGFAVDGQWHHLVLTWKQGEPDGFRSYLDGLLVASRDAVDAPIPSHDAALYFGAFNGVGEFSNGELDEIAVWTRALSEEEVRAGWFKKLSGSEAGLEGYWDFDDDTADDRTPNQHFGHFLGDATTIESGIPGLDALFTDVLPASGDFSLDGLPNGSGYELTAFLDVNGNGRLDSGEPRGSYDSNPLNLAGDLSNLEVLLVEPPSIVSVPEDIRIMAGQDMEFSITVAGSQPMSFQWRKNGEALGDKGSLTGTDTLNLRISSVQEADSGAYSCLVTNAAGEATSTSFLLQVIESGLSISGRVAYDGVQEGQVQVTATQTQAGNKVLNLDGDGDYAETPLTNLSGDEISIQYWFKGSSIQSAVRQQSSGYIVAGWNGTHILSIDGGTSGLSGGSAATDGNWHHLVMTWKRNSPKGFNTYLDGRLVAQRDSAEGEIPDLAAPVYFGAFNGVAEFCNGQLDEIAIWNKALSEAEIAVGWNTPLSGSEEGLIGFWNFDDGLGNDLSGGGNHAALHGDAVLLEADVAGLGGGVYSGQIESPGAFSLSNIPPGSNYVLTAFLDVNGNQAQDVGEPSGVFAGSPFNLTDDLSQTVVTLTEPPTLSAQPHDTRVGPGETARFMVGALGTKPFTYQWLKDGFPLPDGPNAPELVIPNASAQDVGSYSVVVSNLKGEALSRKAVMGVIADGVQLAGQVAYTGNPPGDIHLMAASYLPGNQVLTLDGSGDFVIVPDLIDLSGYELTIQYWFRGSSIQSAVRQQSSGYIVAGWQGLHILSDDGGTGAGVNAGPNVTDGRWHHLLMTWEGGMPNGFRSYVDGQLVEQRDAADSEISFLDAPVYFGAFNGVSEFMEGQLDEIAIWERSLTHEEIGNAWNQPLDGSEEGLLGLWKFDDGTAKDQASYGFDGELNGDAVIEAASIPMFGGDVSTDILSASGSFLMRHVPKGNHYHLTAFVDLNGNFLHDQGEPFAESATNPFNLAADLDGLFLDLGGEVGSVSLGFDRTQDGLLISWPTETTGLQLHRTDSLSQPNWVPVAGVVDQAVTVSPEDATGFFQLR